MGAIFVAVAIILEGAPLITSFETYIHLLSECTTLVWTILILYRNRTVVQQLSREGFDLDIPLILRVCIFGLYVFLGLWYVSLLVHRPSSF